MPKKEKSGKKKKKKTKETASGKDQVLTKRQLAALAAGNVSGDYRFISRPEDYQRG